MAYKHIIYMGAYSLKTWIRKIFEKEIELPEYQRDFTWNSKNGENLKESLEKGYYIPPVTLAKYNDKIYLLDGQQRLTSIICLYLGVWPKDKNKKNIQKEDEEQEYEKEFSPNFTFKILQDLQLGSVKTLLGDPDEFQKEIFEKSTKYLEKQELKFKDIENIFLPYCLIMPNLKEYKDQRDFFAETFRRMNTLGQQLSKKELRGTIFWLYKNIKQDIYTDRVKNFEEELKKLRVFGNDSDMLGYFAIVCNSKKRAGKIMENMKEITNKYSRDTEEFRRYVVDFLLCYGKGEYNNIWDKKDIECIKNNQDRFQDSESYFLDFFRENKKNYKERNISYQDVYLFSFILYVYFSKKEISKDKISELLESARKNMSEYLENLKNSKEDTLENYRKEPNTAKRIAQRLLIAFQVVYPEEYGNE
ncbi:DUF262 domain-containing protein [Helicobacter apodemus]|uniref:GmrSD restriction endonucleases N-terminal domain-containing protein n=1 Tax=Helicobacter apodemus TaxID=135569 RepID=A0A2U8FD81_9HELI|nr:DUF262 domain-containing protein [Helicobacter apodemus]AWI34096.1 hypothetical protein CDV25_04400 [Helicobacter apodemus]